MDKIFQLYNTRQLRIAVINTTLKTQCKYVFSYHTQKYMKYARMKEGNVLFNDALNTFYLRLYGLGHKVKDHSDGESGNPQTG